MSKEEVGEVIENSYISRFYSNQHQLRGITSEEDVKHWEKFQSKCYDKLVYPYIKSFKDGNVVELASGPGIFLRYLKNRGFEKSFGVELAEGYVKLCHAQELNVIQVDALSWLRNQPAASVDVIVAIDFMEHLDKQSFFEFLEDASKALSHNGYLILRGPCADSPFFGLNYYNDITHETVFTSTALKTLMTICNLKIIDIRDEYPNNLNRQNPLSILLIRFLRFLSRLAIFVVTGCRINILSPNVWIVAQPK